MSPARTPEGAPGSPHATSTALTAALQRLAHSRSQLRVVLMPPPAAEDLGPGTDGPGRLLRLLWRRLRRAGRNAPALDLALSALQAWWLSRPWRATAAAWRQGMDTTVVPLVRRHPWAAVGVAAGAGAALVVLRPWRWSVVRGSWPLWRAGLLAQAMQQVSKWPLESALSILMAAVAVLRSPPAPSPPSPPAATPDSPSETASQTAARKATVSAAGH
jgi:hypothetical protein